MHVKKKFKLNLLVEKKSHTLMHTTKLIEQNNKLRLRLSKDATPIMRKMRLKRPQLSKIPNSNNTFHVGKSGIS